MAAIQKAHELLTTPTSVWKYISRPQRDEIADILITEQCNLNASKKELSETKKNLDDAKKNLELTTKDLVMSAEEKEKLTLALKFSESQTEIATTQIDKLTRSLEWALSAIVALIAIDKEAQDAIKKAERNKKEASTELLHEGFEIMSLTELNSPALKTLQDVAGRKSIGNAILVENCVNASNDDNLE
jgi:septal ring factor EnvC (AmiA/AmiB activator)